MHAYVDVTDQAEFEAAITAGDYPHITNNARYEVPASTPKGHTIKVSGTAAPTLVAHGASSPRTVAHGASSPRTVAHGASSPLTVAHGASSPLTVAYDTSSPLTEAYDTSSPRTVAHGASSPRTVAYDTSSPRTVAYDTSSPLTVAYDTSSPRTVAHGASSPLTEAYDTSSPRTEAYDTSSPLTEAHGASSPRTVAHGASSPLTVAYDTSSPLTEAYDTSSPRTVAHDTSSPLTVAHDTSSPLTEAHDYSSVLHTGRGTVTADQHVTVRISGEVTVTGGALTQRVPLTTNPQLVRQVLTHIETHPQEWNQGSWASETPCGTTYCYAGHAVAMSGAVMNINEGTVEVATLPESVRGRFTREHVQISAAARALLGLESQTADRLFGGSNDLDDLRELVDEICAGAEPAAGLLATPDPESGR